MFCSIKDCSEKQSKIERAQREKKEVEKELKKVLPLVKGGGGGVGRVGG